MLMLVVLGLVVELTWVEHKFYSITARGSWWDILQFIVNYRCCTKLIIPINIRSQ